MYERRRRTRLNEIAAIVGLTILSVSAVALADSISPYRPPTPEASTTPGPTPCTESPSTCERLDRERRDTITPSPPATPAQQSRYEREYIVYVRSLVPRPSPSPTTTR